ncbi:MAG: hypothetical protein J6Q82_06730 [Clostridia bacterium]|nr:hypothetical protein [Clostridia bacterium]
MKKLLAFLLVLVMILSISLVACKKEPVASEDDDDDDWGNGGASSSIESSNNTDDNNNNGNNNIPSVTLTWTDVEDVTIYIAHPITLRNSPSDNDKTGITLDLGESVLLVEKSNREWYKVKYNDNEYYIYSYVTVTNGASVRFNPIEGEPVYSSVINSNTSGKESTHNFRWTPCYDNTEKYVTEINALNLYKALTQSETSDNKMQVLALSEDGVWAKVSYKPDANTEAKTLYIKKNYLEIYKAPDNVGGGVNPA